MLKQLIVTAALAAAGGAVPVTGGQGQGKAVAATAARAGAVQRPIGRERPAIAALTLRMEVDAPGLTGPYWPTIFLRTRTGETSIESIKSREGTTFDLALPAGAPDDMVWVRIGRAGFHYDTLLGSRRMLERRAGADRVLDVTELDRVRISALSTALKTLIPRELGGQGPFDDGAHERAVRSLGNDVLLAATFLEGTRTGDINLPGDMADGLQLLENVERFRAFVRQSPAPVTNDAYEAYAQRPTGIPLAVDDLGEATALLPRRVAGQMQTLMPNAQLLFRDGGGGHAWHISNYAAADNGATVSQVDAGAFRVEPDGEPSRHYFPLVQGPNGTEQVLAKLTMTGVVYRRLFVGERHELWSTAHESLETYPGRPDLAPVTRVASSVWHTVSLLRDDPFNRRQVVGRFALPRFCNGTDPGGAPYTWNCEYADTTLSADGSGVRHDVGVKIDAAMEPVAGPAYAMPLNWSLHPAGTLLVADNTGDAMFWRVDRDDAGSEALVYLARSGSGDASRYTAGQTALIRMDAPMPSYDAPAAALGGWRYGSFEISNGGDLSNAPVQVRFDRGTDGRVVQTSSSAGPPAYTTLQRSGWQAFERPVGDVTVGRLYDTRYLGLLSGNVSFASCADAYAAGATACRVSTVRYFRPLRQVGARTYGIEELYTNGAGYNMPPSISLSSRAGWYERIAE